MKSIILVFLLCLALFSCRKDDIVLQSSDINLKGTWVDPEYSDTVVTYTKAENLIENHYGFTFKAGNVVVYRQNSGFCGTHLLLLPITKEPGHRVIPSLIFQSDIGAEFQNIPGRLFRLTINTLFSQLSNQVSSREVKRLL